MIVQKFGGTSVGDADRIESVCALIRKEKERRPVVVVVSAMAGVTNRLFEASQSALVGKTSDVEASLESIEALHRSTIAALVKDPKDRLALEADVKKVGEEARLLCQGMSFLKEAPPRSLDALGGLGESLSSSLLTVVLRSRGMPAEKVDARDLILTDSSFGQATVDFPATETRCAQIRDFLREGVIPVIPGYVASDAEGRTTTLGRGGSDYTAAILGSVLNAEEIQIWTDVDGILSADPKIAPKAKVIPEISFEEAAELAHFGAKVLHPSTLQPAIEKEIPIIVLNSFRPEGKGTVIRRKRGLRPGLRAIACKKGIPAMTLSSNRMLLAHGFLAEVFDVFKSHRISIDLVATSEVSVSLTFDAVEGIKEALPELERLAEVEVTPDNAIICCVGQKLSETSGIAGRIFSQLKDINVRIVSFGAKDNNMSFVVAETDADEAVRRLHREFFEEAA